MRTGALRGARGLTTTLSAAALTAVLVSACGARTGLEAPEPEPGAECVSLDATAQLADLDVFIMMDSSGSMQVLTAQGVPKWQAVRDALAAFLLDGDSKGVGAAINFFPIVNEAIPEQCPTDDTCGLPGACHRYSVCLPSGEDFCDTAQDCADAGFPDDTCEKLGFCSVDQGQVCLLEGGGGCDSSQGVCSDVGLCDNHYYCDESVYADLTVDVAQLPAGATPVLEAIDGRVPDGGTTTLPALGGAIQAATEWTSANPGHKAIVVLATDGLPTMCDPALDGDDPQQGIVHLAEAAGKGVEQGIQTWVIGVFGPDEQAEAAPNLDLIAQGGGTESAYLISTESNVTEEFLQALNEVRLTSKACEFGIPLVDGALPDLKKLEVVITPAGGEPVTVERKVSAGACDPQTGGFFYDKPLGSTPPPGRVILCPQSCAIFGTAADRTVQLKVSCD